MKVIKSEDGRAPIFECGVCNGPLLFVDSPPLPAGYSAGTWRGWFHLDESATCRHFGNVGWHQLDRSAPPAGRS